MFEPPDGFEIAVLPGRGRSLVARKPVEAGALVLRQRPYAWVLQDDQVPTRCDYCTAICEPPLRCGHCRFVRYCSRDHQKAAWGEGHKEECAALRAAAPRVPPPTIRLLTRVLWRRNREKGQQQQKDGEQSAAACGTEANDGGFAQVEALQHHWEALDAARRVAYAQMAALAWSYMRGASTAATSSADNIPTADGAAVRAAALLLARFAANAHTMCDAELRPYGVGLYPLGAMINHGDPPNAYQSFSGATIEFRALRRCSVGDEVTIAYAEAAAPRLARRKQLLQQYFFDLDGISSKADNGAGKSSSISISNNTSSGGDSSSGEAPAVAAAAAMARGSSVHKLAVGEALYPPADVKLWGAAPEWCELLEPGPPMVGAMPSAPLHSTSSSGSVKGRDSCHWAVVGFGPRPQPPWRQDPPDAEMCRVNATGPTTPHSPIPGGILLLPAAGAGDDAAAAAAALGPLAAASFELGVGDEGADEDRQQQLQQRLLHLQQQEQGQQQAAGKQEGVLVLQWGDWGPATRELAVAAARQLQLVCGMQQRAEALSQAGRSADAADCLVAALHATDCLPPAVAAAAVAHARLPSLTAPADCRVVLGPRHVLCQQLLSALLNACVSSGDRWPVARAAAEALSHCYEAAYPPVWPNLGLHHAMVAKLQMLLEAPAAAAASAEKAAAILKITHPTSPVLDEVLRLRYEAEQEAQYNAAAAAGDGGRRRQV